MFVWDSAAVMRVIPPLIMVGLVLGTAVMELVCGVAALVAIQQWRRPPNELAAPWLAISALAVMASIGGDVFAGVQVGWMLVLVVILPVLSAHREAALHWGGMAAGTAGVIACLWAVGMADWPAKGPYSHHLTLGYALLPALAVMLHTRRWLCALGIAMGVASTLSLGPALGMLVVTVGVLWPAGWALLAGVGASLGIIWCLQGEPIVQERAVLWGAGIMVWLEHPLGVGPGGSRAALEAAQHDLSFGFHFPTHAHDSVIQIGVELGWPGVAAWGWLLMVLWRRTSQAGRAGLAAVLVGGLTQDTLGDLEVVRAMCAWSIMAEPNAAASVGVDRERIRGNGR